MASGVVGGDKGEAWPAQPETPEGAYGPSSVALGAHPSQVPGPQACTSCVQLEPRLQETQHCRGVGGGGQGASQFPTTVHGLPPTTCDLLCCSSAEGDACEHPSRGLGVTAPQRSQRTWCQGGCP